MENRVTIITGQIKSGKTTYLRKLISSLNNVGGIIQIADKKKRFFVDISSGDKIELTSESINNDTFNIGRFVFRSSAFTWAKEALERSLDKDCGIIVIDEYGPLEMKGKGLEPIFTKIIKQIRTNNKQQLYIIIREALLEKFLLKFDLDVEEINIERLQKKSINRS